MCTTHIFGLSNAAIVQDNELWRQLAEAKWGGTAVALSAENGIAGPETWFAFCRHRMCVKQHRCLSMPGSVFSNRTDEELKRGSLAMGLIPSIQNYTLLDILLIECEVLLLSTQEVAA